MFYYPTVDDYETVVSTIKYTLQNKAIEVVLRLM